MGQNFSMFKKLFQKKNSADVTPLITEQNNKLSKFKDFFSNLQLKFKKKPSTEESAVLKEKKDFLLLSKIKSFHQSLLNKLGKKSVNDEPIVGLEISHDEIKFAQLSNKTDKDWYLEEFYEHKIQSDQPNNILENPDFYVNELKTALANAKLKTKNVAFAVPVTSAIIRVVTSPLLSDKELENAIATDTLWDNLVQLTDNLKDYSIFHQVISRDTVKNTMDILFVASKLSDVNNYTAVIKKAGLIPVIIDVKCFSIKSAVDQMVQLSGSIEESSLTVVLEFGLDENYLMILHENNPIIVDIFLRAQDRDMLSRETIENHDEAETFMRRYASQLKQAILDYELKFERKIRNIKVISNLHNIETYLGMFRKNLVGTGFYLFDPLENVNIPDATKAKLKKNKSEYASVIGLAFRKLDVFGYFKFVKAVKNINLLPDRESIISAKKTEIFSKIAFKGIAVFVFVTYLVFFATAMWRINSYNTQLNIYDSIIAEHKQLSELKMKLMTEIGMINKSLQLSKSISSNQSSSYKILSQIANSVPPRVRLTKLEYDGLKQMTVEGLATNDADILKLIRNLSSQPLIDQAALETMASGTAEGVEVANKNFKGFKIICSLRSGA
jgi:type IV pilus assembly protein PilN